MRILLTGATGFLGGQLAEALHASGHELTLLSRRDGVAVAGTRTHGWEPNERGEWFRHVDGQDAVIHLAGEQAVGVRWTPDVKRRIRSSRVQSTERLVEALEASTQRPRLFVCASGVGVYGARPPEEELDERSNAGEDFLADVCRDWERAAEGARALGVRVVETRLGIVLGRGGGALPQLLAPFRFFVGGPVGDGQQMVSWIHLTDALAAFERTLVDEELDGPLNVTSPEPVSNGEMAKVIGTVLGRPSMLHAPSLALKLLFGEGAQPLLTGQRAVPRRLLERGFEFRFPAIAEALRDLLGTPPVKSRKGT